MLKKFLKQKELWLILLGLFLRLSLQITGHNFDFESYKIVGKLVYYGKNVYASTNRYNYGPIWFLLLGSFYKISLLFQNFLNPVIVYRTLIILTLTAADFSITLWLKKNFGKKAALWFWLNPLSIYITGWHNQFDNLAIAIGLWAISLYEKRFIISLVLIGVSLVTKHVFALLPIWLVFREKNFKKKFLLTIPYFIFLISFVPFALNQAAQNGILKNVFLYTNNFPNLYPLSQKWKFLNPLIFLTAVSITGWFLRNIEIEKNVLYYLASFTAFLPMSAWQYYAIPLSFFAAIDTSIGLVYSSLAMLTMPILTSIINKHKIAYYLYFLILISIGKSTFLKRKVKESKKSLLKVTVYSLIFIYSLVAINYFIKLVKSELQQKAIVKTFIRSKSVFKSKASFIPLFKDTTVEGKVRASMNNLGAIYIPFKLINPSGRKFFNQHNAYEISLWENNKLYFKETRKLYAGLTRHGLAFGFPPIKNSAGKTYTIKLKTNIKEGKDYFYIDPYGYVELDYALSPSELKNPVNFTKFIIFKLVALFYLNKMFYSLIFVLSFIALIKILHRL